MKSTHATWQTIHLSSGTLVVAGGTVEATTGFAIITGGSRDIIISGDARITNASTERGAIRLANDRLLIKGGTVENTSTGYAIRRTGSSMMHVDIPFGESAIIRSNGTAIEPDTETINIALTLVGSIARAGTTFDGSTLVDYNESDRANYNYLQFDSAKMVKNMDTNQEYGTLQAAMTDTTSGQTIQMLDDITLTQAVSIANGNNTSFTLDLNGKTVDSLGNIAITHQGTGMLTIADSTNTNLGKITSRMPSSDHGTIVLYNRSGGLTITGGTIENTLGGGSRVIHSRFGSNLSISGGKLESHGGVVILNADGGIVTISGGEVRTTDSMAVYYLGHGKIIVSGDSLITNEHQYAGGTIYLHHLATATALASLEILGGTIENTHINGNAIEAGANRNIAVQSGSSIVKGGSHAMSKAPTLNNVTVTASVYHDGSHPVPTYLPGDIATYKYLQFEPFIAPSTLTGTAAISSTTPRIGDVLSGSLEGGNNTGTLSYSWKSDGVPVGTGTSYTVTVADLGRPITLDITSSVETGTVTSTATAAVLKKSAPAAPAAPTLDSKTHNSVTLTPNESHEFSKDGITWQTDNVFAGLTPSTGYTFHQRLAATADTEASAASAGFAVTTIATPDEGNGSDGGSGGNPDDNPGDGSDNGSGGNSGGGSGSASSGTPAAASQRPVTVILPSSDNPTAPTRGEIRVQGTVDTRGNVSLNITRQDVVDAFEKALADARKNGSAGNGIAVVLRVDTGSSTGTALTVNLPKAVQDTIIANQIVTTIVVVANPDITLGMDLATVEELNRQARSDVSITATPINGDALSEEAQQAIGNRPVFDLRVNTMSGRQIQHFGTGSVMITIPYLLGENENPAYVQAVYVDEQGQVHWLENSVYDEAAKTLRFSTHHFSTYGVGYQETSTATPQAVKDSEPVSQTSSFTTAFTDIETHWAKENIEYVVNQGLFSGTSPTTFSPNTPMTRGMFVTVLGKLANAEISSDGESSYTDVTPAAYYSGYIEWAGRQSIAKGIGHDVFAPDQAITREQMAVMMQKYANAMGLTLPKTREENTFTDDALISAYARDAVTEMQLAGIIGGKNENRFDPQGTATRAEVATVLRRFAALWALEDHL